MTQRIPLPNKGWYALVDDEHYTLVAARSWHAAKAPHSKTWYARTNFPLLNKKKIVLLDMHRLIMVGVQPAQTGIRIDHRNGDGLDNRSANLRFCTHAENMANTRTRSNPGKSSVFRGVTKSPIGRWIVQVAETYVGTFDDETEAARVYDRIAAERFGEFARLNFPIGASQI